MFTRRLTSVVHLWRVQSVCTSVSKLLMRQTKSSCKGGMRLTDVYWAAVEAVDPKEIVRKQLRLDDLSGLLHISQLQAPLKVNHNITVVGFGKAAGGMMEGFLDVVGKHVVKAVLSVPEPSNRSASQKASLQRENLKTYFGPKDNMTNDVVIDATSDIIKTLMSVPSDGLVFVLVTGGGSALLCKPVDDISLADLVRVTKLMSTNGFTINEMNKVRQRLDSVKGGGLIGLTSGNLLISFILSDIIGDPIDLIASGPTVPNTHYESENLINLFQQRELHLNLPHSVINVLRKPRISTSSRPDSGKHVHNIVVGNNTAALSAAHVYVKSQGYLPITVSLTLQGDIGVACQLFLGWMLFCQQEMYTESTKVLDDGLSTEHETIRQSLKDNARQLSEGVYRGICLLVGGEPVVNTNNVARLGQGGRATHASLLIARELSAWDSSHCYPEVLVAGTDGADGPTDAAGAQVDHLTWQRITNGDAALKRFDSYTALEQATTVDGFPCLFKPGLTGTNVMDVFIGLLKFK